MRRQREAPARAARTRSAARASSSASTAIGGRRLVGRPSRRARWRGSTGRRDDLAGRRRLAAGGQAVLEQRHGRVHVVLVVGEPRPPRRAPSPSSPSAGPARRAPRRASRGSSCSRPCATQYGRERRRRARPRCRRRPVRGCGRRRPGGWARRRQLGGGGGALGPVEPRRGPRGRRPGCAARAGPAGRWSRPLVEALAGEVAHGAEELEAQGDARVDRPHEAVVHQGREQVEHGVGGVVRRRPPRLPRAEGPGEHRQPVEQAPARAASSRP